MHISTGNFVLTIKQLAGVVLYPHFYFIHCFPFIHLQCLNHVEYTYFLFQKLLIHLPSTVTHLETSQIFLDSHSLGSTTYVIFTSLNVWIGSWLAHYLKSINNSLPWKLQRGPITRSCRPSVWM